MAFKRILILHHETSGPLQLQNSLHKVVTCTNTTEALSILMGGSSAFGKEDYAKTGKVRPEILVLDSAFLETYEGFELLEIIRKYYSLQAVRIFIFDKNISSLDPALFTRYRICGKLTGNYNLDGLTEANTATTTATGTTGAYLSVGLLAGSKDWISAAMNFLKGKTMLISGAKTVLAGKVAVATSCVVAVGITITPFINDKKSSEPIKPAVTKVAKVQVSTELPKTIKPDSVTTFTLKVTPAAKNETAPRKKITPVAKAAIVPAQEITESEVTINRPERQYRI